ncbi:hypothetical protein RJ640_001072 [Escallonia rubra]|uniref:Disease resistance protein RGA3 n=1 Tax=Escallonia rubra TaxID=112253 RepID=A0AA88TZR1_9ASTE|nr:hypothetical protein RJ640_001072 [Escallonia rubra]
MGVTGELNKLNDTLVTVKAVLTDAGALQETSVELSVWLGRLEDVCYAIDDIVDEFDIVVLKRQVNQRSIKRKERTPTHGLRETHSFIIAYNVIGRDDDQGLLVDKLVNVDDREGVAVIPIIGIGGLGKPTLAKLVYNDEKVVSYFDLRIWVCVSDEFDIRKIIGNIVDKNNLTLQRLQEHLQENLSARRYLLILDDVWNEHLRKWRELRDLLLCGAPGSKIVVTTRTQSVVSTLDPIYVHNLEGLSDKESLFLLMELSFGKGQRTQCTALKKIGEQIVGKGKGVPLGITTLGCLLHGNTELKDWCSVRDNAIWNVQQTETGILPALKLSYNHLPPHLKRCFAVCASFSKDHEFHSSQLINIWMALGLLGSRDQFEEEECVGNTYFTELCSRSFFQDVRYSLVDYEFRMHDLIHDLALSVMGSECLVLNNDEVPNQEVQHVHISNKGLFRDGRFPSSVLQLRKLRMIRVAENNSIFWNQSVVDMYFSRFKCLRVLVLRGPYFTTLPRSIKNLVHLKYLELRSSQLESLPRSICKLQSLQTLQVTHCWELRKLPRDFGNLINLRCLSLTTQERFLPAKFFQRLTCLRTLHILACEKLECLFQTKGNKTQGVPSGLRKLVISDCNNLGSSPGLAYLTRLEWLLICGCEKLDLNMDEESIREHDGGLTRLQVLKMSSLPNLVTLPQWLVLNAANTLTQLALEWCENLTTLPENLNALQELAIFFCPSLMSMPEGLYALKEIRITCCPILEERCQRETGEDWYKIAHVPNIYYDTVEI